MSIARRQEDLHVLDLPEYACPDQFSDPDVRFDRSVLKD
jgi:hypothetical protein